MVSASQYPIYGPEVQCPHCRQTIPALVLTDSYLCSRHGAFEANPETQELVHVQSGRHWRRWEERWYRQHTHPDGIRFEIHEELDRLYTQGLRATKVIIAERYRKLMTPYLEHGAPWQSQGEEKVPKLYGLPVTFSDALEEAPERTAEKASEEASEDTDKTSGDPSKKNSEDTLGNLSDKAADSRWEIINFDLEKEPGVPTQYRYLRIFE